MPPAIATTMLTPNAIGRFFSFLNVLSSNECWEWKGNRRAGYGGFRVKAGTGGIVGAHRIAYFLFKGDLLENHFICHRCDNPACANPNHLFQATPQENSTDMVIKGRNVLTLGTINGMAKLTDADIKEIRSLAKQGITQTAIAKRFAIDQSQVSRIINKRHWSHI